MRAKEFLLERWTRAKVTDYFDSQRNNQVNASNIQVSQPMHGAILLTFDNITDLTRCFFRPSEWANSGRNVDMVEFLDHWLDKQGQADYFSFWDGFNISDRDFESWQSHTKEFSQAEKILVDTVKHHTKNLDQYCVLGIVRGDPATQQHELFHARYYLDLAFKKSADQLLQQFKKQKEYKTMCKVLKQKLDYIKHVDEEIAAYLYAGSQIKMVFGINCADWIKKFKELDK